jgi:hypothetical protein
MDKTQFSLLEIMRMSDFHHQPLKLLSEPIKAQLMNV